MNDLFKNAQTFTVSRLTHKRKENLKPKKLKKILSLRVVL